MERRKFFKGAALGAAGLVVKSRTGAAEAAPVTPPPSVLVPTEGHAQTEYDYSPAQAPSGAPAAADGAAQAQPASDFMVDVLKKLDFDYAAINPDEPA